MQRHFKQCTPCKATWHTRDLFLCDPALEITEYQANFDNLATGVFIFNHSCGATLSLSVRNFNGLYEGPVFNDRATGSDECPGYCLHKDDLRHCSVKCECAYVRNIIGIIKNWSKAA